MPGFINTDQAKRPDGAQAIVSDIHNGRTTESCEELMPLVQESGHQNKCNRPDSGVAQTEVLVLKTPVGEGGQNSILCNRSEEHTSELQSRLHLVCRLLLEKKKHQLSHQRSLEGDGISNRT